MLSLNLPVEALGGSGVFKTFISIPEFFSKHFGTSDLSEVMRRNPDGLPYALRKEMDKALHGGNRACDTCISIGDSAVGLRHIELPHAVWKPREDKPAPRKRVSLEFLSFTALVHNLCNWLVEQCYLTTDHLPSVTETEVSWFVPPPGREKELVESTQRFLAKLIFHSPKGKQQCFKRNFVSLFFKGGPSFGRSEINLTAVQRKVLLASKGQLGLRETMFFGTVVFQNLVDPTGFTKAWKATMTNVEKTVFHYTGLLTCKREVESPAHAWVNDLALLVCPSLYKDRRVLSRADYEANLEFLAYFTSSREFASPDEETALDVYEHKYVPMLIEDRLYANTDQFDPQEMTDLYEAAKADSVGKTQLLSRLLANHIIGESKTPKDRASLQRMTCPLERLSSSSDYHNTRRNHGHYNAVLTEVIPWMKTAVREWFDVILTEETPEGVTEFVCSDFGTPLCELKDADLPIWQILLRTTPVEGNFLEQLEDGTIWNRVGLDGRLGTIIYLWSTVQVRPWLRLIDAVGAEKLTTMTSEALLHLSKTMGIPLPKERCVPVCEPGAKVRWVSCAEASVLFFQQPLAEDLRDIYARVQGCNVGLQSSDHLFRFEQSFADHFLDVIVNRKAGIQKITPEYVEGLVEIARIEALDSSADKDIKLLHTLFRVAGGLEAFLHVRVAEAISVSYGIPLLSALYSTVPLIEVREALRPAILVRSTQEGGEHWKGHLNVAYEELERRVESDPTLLSQVLVAATNDQMSATDTLNHQIGYRNLSTLMRELGYLQPIQSGVITSAQARPCDAVTLRSGSS